VGMFRRPEGKVESGSHKTDWRKNKEPGKGEKSEPAGLVEFSRTVARQRHPDSSHDEKKGRLKRRERQKRKDSRGETSTNKSR